MSYLSFSEAFAKFGAKPINLMWAVTAIANDGALVISCWDHFFKKVEADTFLYCDCLSRWKGNKPGYNLLKQHVEEAFASNWIVRGIVATPEKPELVEQTTDASKIKKKFHILEGKVGRLTAFDGNNYVIEFRAG